jgi:RimJ/RimL family protein N-acetyltransferase
MIHAPSPDAPLTHAPIVETERLVLRGPMAKDLEPFIAFRGSDRAKWVGGPSDRVEAWRGFAGAVGHWHLLGFGRWVVTRRGEDRAIGLVGGILAEGWPEREIGWTMFEGEGEGYAFEAATAVRATLYRDFGWTSAVSYVDPANTRSAALAERLNCAIDPDAEPLRIAPHVQVWRHPAPEALA